MRISFWGAKQLAPEILRQALTSKERILAWAAHGGGVVAATNFGIISIDNHDATRILWTEVIAGKWEPPLMTVTCLPDLKTLGWQLEEPGELPQAIRDRITAHVIIDRTISFPGHASVRFIALRTTTGIRWLTNAQDEDWAVSTDGQAAIAVELGNLRALLGI